MLRKTSFLNGGIRRSLRAGLPLVAAWISVAAPPAAAQSVRFDNVSTSDRSVVLTWNKAPGDTMTAAGRNSAPSLVFVVPKGLGFVASSFQLHQGISGRGAGTQKQGAYEIRITDPADLGPAGTLSAPTYPANFSVTGAFQFGKDYIGVAFSRPVNQSQATTASNYQVGPSVTVQSVSIQANGQTAILKTSAPLAGGTTYNVTVGNVTGDDGRALTGSTQMSFTAVTGNVVDISQLFDGSIADSTVVTVTGQVFEPQYDNAGTITGYVMDGSGRGARVFGPPPYLYLMDKGNVVSVTGLYTRSLTKRQIQGFEGSKNHPPVTLFVDLRASGQPRLAPEIVPLKLSQSSRWEGRYIQSQGELYRVESNDAENVFRYWVTQPETLFTGYQVWRTEAGDTTTFQLLRTYSLLDSTWTFSKDGPRIFADPDSIISRGTERDVDRVDIPGPFNGFEYFYSITWYKAYVDASSNPPRIDIYPQQTIQQGAMATPVLPSKAPRVQTPLLGSVRVVPNPYSPSAKFGRQSFPGEPRVQFVNLPDKAKVDIYTVAGDKVRSLVHDVGTDALDWDLTNNNGKSVAPGIYVYYVTASGETTMGHFVIAQ